jgi:hypothetical protein
MDDRWETPEGVTSGNWHDRYNRARDPFEKNNLQNRLFLESSVDFFVERGRFCKGVRVERAGQWGLSNNF